MFYEEFAVGQQFPIDPVTVEKEKMIAFAEAYDPLPIHLDEEYAQASPFGGLIAPGVMSFMSVWATFVRQNVLGDELLAGKSTKIEWFAPVRAGDVLHGCMTIVELGHRGHTGGSIWFTIDITNQDGTLVIRDTTEAVVKTKRGKES